jgi:sugar lactone lactonase YvrE
MFIGEHRMWLAVPVVASLVGSALSGCSPKTCTGFDVPAPIRAELIEVAAFPEHQVTGVAVSSRGRVFVSFPRWGGAYQMAVGELLADGSLIPFPDAGWNRLNEDLKDPPQGDVFVCVQSVHVDDNDRLWVLDPAAPKLEDVIRHAGGGPKLLEIDLVSNSVVRTIKFDEAIAPARSYLNDVRVDTRTNQAFITDSGIGGLVVVNLSTGVSRRVLSGHAMTTAPQGFAPIIEGRELRQGGSGEPPRVNSDGIALDARNNWLYWQSLTDNRLRRISTRVLASPHSTDWQIEDSVQDLGGSVVTDGMLCDNLGNVYFTALEHDAIVRRDTRGNMLTLAKDPRISWPDSLAIGPAGPVAGGNLPGATKWLYFTTSQIHRTPMFSPDGTWPAEPYRVFRVRPPGN